MSANNSPVITTSLLGIPFSLSPCTAPKKNRVPTASKWRCGAVGSSFRGPSSFEKGASTY